MKVAAQWRDRAIHEAQDAFDWYEAKSLGLGERFLEELDAHVDALLQRPKGYSQWRGPYKRINLHRFPYILVFRLAKNTVVIFQRLPQQAEPGGMGPFPLASNWRDSLVSYHPVAMCLIPCCKGTWALAPEWGRSPGTATSRTAPAAHDIPRSRWPVAPRCSSRTGHVRRRVRATVVRRRGWRGVPVRRR